LIQEGASTFLRQEYKYTAIFVALFSIIIYLTAEQDMDLPFTTFAFIIGAFTSMLSGLIGMQIAVRANVRTAKLAEFGLDEAFKVAFRGGMVLGFVLVGLALLMLQFLIIGYREAMGRELLVGGEHRMD
jgi:Na+/H+-translocating membrane pyrophosphatase